MQSTIYINNFRGFKETYLTIGDVNFLVGENSTGKTSILRLIKVISNSDFWLRPGFQEIDDEFGVYSEITDSLFFEVGYTLFREDKVERFVKLKFVERGRFSDVDELWLMDKSYVIQLKVLPNTIRYKLKYCDNSSLLEESTAENFKNWINGNLFGFEKIKNKSIEKVDYLPLLMVAKYVLDMELKEKVPKGIPFVPFLSNFSWLAPIRTEPKKTYDNHQATYSPDGTHTPYVIKSILERKKTNNSRVKFENVMNKFGQESGLYDKIDVNVLGKSPSAPFEIFVEQNNKRRRLTNVGYGVSQILPLIVEIVYEEDLASFALQQPEIHLHPKGQAAFGDLVYKSASLERKRFIIETHSDYTIDRYRLRLKKGKNEEGYRPVSQIVFFHKNQEGNSLSVIAILSDGNYAEHQPPDFRDFFIKEELALLQI